MKDSNLTCQYSNTFAMYFFSSLIIVKNYLYVVTSDKSHQVEILIGESKVEIVENKLYFFFFIFYFPRRILFPWEKGFYNWTEMGRVERREANVLCVHCFRCNRAATIVHLFVNAVPMKIGNVILLTWNTKRAF